MTPSNLRSKSSVGAILLIFVAFVSLGLPDGLLGVAWPSIRETFARPIDSLGAVLVASTAGYLTSSFLSGYAVSRLGVGWLLSLSCAMTGLSLLAVIIAPAWPMIPALAALAGVGAGAIDGGINTHVAANYGERLMHWLHASWGLGITLGPLIMTVGLERFDSWRVGYAVVGVAQVALGALFAFSVSMWQSEPPHGGDVPARQLTDFRTSYRQTLSESRVWLSLTFFFLFAGSEATAGMWIYSVLTESRGIAPPTAGLLTGAFWGAFTGGRILAGAFASHLGGAVLIRGCLLSAVTGTALLAWNPHPVVAIAGILILGLSLAPVFPSLVSGTDERVGAAHAANTIGMQIGTAGLGAAVLPSLAGILAKRFSFEAIPMFLLGVVGLLVLLLPMITPRAKTVD